MTNDAALMLANCLEALERRELTFEQYLARHPDQQAALTELVPVALRLRAVPRVRPSPDFRADARARLIAQLPPRHLTGTRRAGRLMPMLAVLAVLIVLGSSIIAASAQSLPNDPLYPVKITIEHVRLALSSDQLTRGELSLGFAGERLSEVQRLIDQGRGDDAADTLDAFARQIQSAAEMAHNLPVGADRDALLARLRQSADQSAVVLADNEVRLPASVQPAMARAREALRAVPSDAAPVPPPASTEPPTATSTPTVTATATPHPRPLRTPLPPPDVTPQPGPPPTLPGPVVPVTATPAIHHWPTPVHGPTFVPTTWPTLPATGRPSVEPPTWPPTRTPWATIDPWPTWPAHGSPEPTQTWPTPMWPTPMWPTPRHR